MNVVTDFFDDDSVETEVDPNELYAVPEDERLPDDAWIVGGDNIAGFDDVDDVVEGEVVTVDE